MHLLIHITLDVKNNSIYQKINTVKYGTRSSRYNAPLIWNDLSRNNKNQVFFIYFLLFFRFGKIQVLNKIIDTKAYVKNTNTHVNKYLLQKYLLEKKQNKKDKKNTISTFPPLAPPEIV